MNSGIPPDLYSSVLQYILRPIDLSRCCLVDSRFRAFTLPLLYGEIRIFAWMSRSKQRVVQLLETLASSAKLGKWVFVLELRIFPHLGGSNTQDLESLIGKALLNTLRLHTVIWTRSGSLSDSLLGSLKALPALRRLEINGYSRDFDARLLLGFQRLDSLAIIMPDRNVGRVLGSWLKLLAPNLKALSLICKSGSGVINDFSLNIADTDFPLLEQLHITGCTQLSVELVTKLIRSNRHGLLSLRLEGMSKAFNLNQMTRHGTEITFSNLRALTVTFSASANDQSALAEIPTELAPIAEIVRLSPSLTDLSIHPSSTPTSYSSAGPDGTSAPAHARRGTLSLPLSFIEILPATLRSLAINRLALGSTQLINICARLSKLEQLYFMLDRTALIGCDVQLSRLPALRALHLTFPFSLDSADLLGMSNADTTLSGSSASEDSDADDDSDVDGRHHGQGSNALSSHYEQVYLGIVRACRSLQEFGVQNRVWQVERSYLADNTQLDGWRTEVRLGRRENPSVAEQFLVVRI
ncbi:hypothetical protein BKA62DRAFT_689283 [Auriculariales sp. MPI-PUGE-AT-0066]|nr:hypothetical protein BKA62DRAFT_689283 [Auriculariales sp. MPI-PUGE-AT-0066]